MAVPLPRVQKLLLDGKNAAEAGRLSQAEKSFDAALSLDPGCAYGYFYRSGLRLERGNQAGAADDFQALAALPVDALVAYRELDNLLPDRCPGLLERLSAMPQRWARVLESFALRHLGRNEEAVASMKRAVAAAPRDPVMRAFLARVRIVYRYVDEGAADLEAACGMAPRSGWLKAWLGEARRRQGRFPEALRLLDEAVRLAPGYRRAYAWRGSARLQLGRVRAALRDLDHALSGDRAAVWGERDYSLAWALNQRHEARKAAGDARGAVEDLVAARRINPRYAWCYNPSLEPRVFAQAVSALGKPKGAWMWGWLGQTHLQAGNLDAAERALRKAAALDGSEADFRLWLGQVEHKRGRVQEARRHWRRAVSLNPSSSEAQAWLGGLARADGRLEEAVRRLGRAVQADPVCAWAWAWRGEALLRQGRPAEAERDLDAALGIHEALADAWVWRAEARLLQGRRSAAASDARRALELHPGHERAALVAGLARGSGRRPGPRASGRRSPRRRNSSR